MAYEWVGDPKLRDVAYLEASKEGKGPSEAKVKEAYIKLGGHVLEEIGKPSKATFKETIKKLAKKKK